MTEQARCLKARYYKGMANHAGQDSGIAIPVLTTNKGEGIKTAIKIIGEINSSQDGKVLSIDGIANCHSAGHGNNPKIANTLDTSCNQGIFVQVSDELIVYAVWYEKYQCYIAIRKLTPKECFRLQGWSDDYFEKAQFVNSDSQLYKQAGNGVTVTVIEAIARKMNVDLN